MNYGSWTYNKVQLGRESTPGTAVAATAVWRGPFADIEDARMRQTAEEQVGLLMTEERLFDTQLAAMVTMPSTELTYEQVLHILEAGVKTATPTGAGPYVYVYSFPTTESLNTIKTYTIEAGNVIADGDVRETEYSFVESFTLSGAQGESWKMAANWRGRQVKESTFTGALSLPAVEEAIFANTFLYIDPSGGTVGTTQKAGVLTSASIQVATGVEPKFTGDGVLYFSAHAFRRPVITFTLTLQLEDSDIVKAERTAFENKAIRLIQLRNVGSNDREFKIDMATRYSKVHPYQNSDQNTTVQLEGRGILSSADNLVWAMTVTNNVATVP